ncbi:hypothetical protein [Cohnella lupini]|uniref:Uncharacterized protein n=1 Tax=Cohnella lupini TaxID=1294267 RepID=A0A3D9HTH8_9BACL|nr:hypothetical protein [Cohnella lupini]RED52813.1 hypothetical protein DFP95_13017 [Cohnella lupini]
MGGKTKILDPKQLQAIFLESRRFEQKAGVSLQNIQTQLGKWNDPTHPISLSDKREIAVKDALSRVSNGIASLKQTMESTSEFIDGKLLLAAQLAQEDLGFAGSSDKAKGIPYDLKLKK